MNVGVVTVFKTENCGSFLQAWALKEQLSSMGNDVCFCDYVSARNLGDCIRDSAKCILRLRFKRAKSILSRKRNYRKVQKDFVVSNSHAPFDVCFFGSDTIWNFKDEIFKNNASFFTGANIDKPCYSYSVSVDSTNKETFIENEDIIKNIQKFRKIAVRDKHTEMILDEIYPRDKIVRTVDPTLLWDEEAYTKNFLSKKCSLPRCIFVYYFGSIPKDIWDELKAFSRKRNLKIVSVGFYDKMFDISLSNSPANFITAFSSAEYIFTNTFHGCVFSTIFNKQFATDGIHKKKIEGFLEEFSLLDRVVKKAEDVESVLTSPVDYEKVNGLVSQARKRSVEYLQGVIDEVKTNE